MQPIGEDERLIFSRNAHFLVILTIRLNLPQVSCATETMFQVGGRHEVCHTFVQPEVIPIPAGHHIAPPLMRKFMSAEPDVLVLCKHRFAIRFAQYGEAAHLLSHVAGR